MFSKKERELLEEIKQKPVHKIYIEPDFVTCKICGAQLKRISNTHLMFKHQITSKEYLEKFPEAKLYCQTTLKKFSKRSKVMWGKPGHKDKMKKILKEVLNKPEERQRRSNVAKELHRKGVYSSEETKRKYSESMREEWKDPHSRMARLRSLREKMKEPEVREKISNHKKVLWSDPDHIYNSPEYREKLSSSSKEAMKSFELRKKISDKLTIHGRQKQPKYRD